MAHSCGRPGEGTWEQGGKQGPHARWICDCQPELTEQPVGTGREEAMLSLKSSRETGQHDPSFLPVPHSLFRIFPKLLGRD